MYKIIHALIRLIVMIARARDNAVKKKTNKNEKQPTLKEKFETFLGLVIFIIVGIWLISSTTGFLHIIGFVLIGMVILAFLEPFF